MTAQEIRDKVLHLLRTEDFTVENSFNPICMLDDGDVNGAEFFAEFVYGEDDEIVDVCLELGEAVGPGRGFSFGFDMADIGNESVASVVERVGVDWNALDADERQEFEEAHSYEISELDTDAMRETAWSELSNWISDWSNYIEVLFEHVWIPETNDTMNSFLEFYEYQSQEAEDEYEHGD